MAQPSHRFPTAIVSLDLCGYSRLTEQDEIGTHRALMTCLRTILEPIVLDRRGVIVKSTGDGALIRFPTASLAVEAMIHFQEHVGASEADSPSSRRLVFRVGIHLAPTIQEDGDVYGHGVNLAVRLQECAEPGSICLSEAIAHRLDPKATPPLERLGRRGLKNIKERIDVYCWRGGASIPVQRRYRAAGVVVAILLACMIVPTAAIDKVSPDLAKTDTLAGTQAPKEATPLENAKKPFLIAGALPTIMQPARETTAHAVSLAVEEDWAVPYRHLLASGHDHEIKSKMTAAEQSLESRGKIAEDAYIQAFALYNQHTPEAFAQAIGELEEALVLKPGYQSAHAILAAIYWVGLQNRWQLGQGLTQTNMLSRVEDHLGQANQIDPLTRMVRSERLTSSGRHDQAIKEAEEAIALNPSHAVSHYAKGRALLFAGHAREAEAPIRDAIRLNPHAPRYLFGLALAQFNMDDFDAAERTLARAITRNSEDDWLYLLMAATQGYLGLKTEARQAIGRFDSLSLVRRGWFASQIPHVHHWPFRDSGDQDRLHVGMVLAGIPNVVR